MRLTATTIAYSYLPVLKLATNAECAALKLLKKAIC